MGIRRTFDKDFKLAAVRLSNRRGYTSAASARELEIDPNLLYAWRKRLASAGKQAFPGHGRQAGLAGANRQLAAENARLRTAARILHEAGAIATGDAAGRFRFIHANRKRWPVAALCAALAVSRGGYYRARARPPSRSARRRAELMAKVRKVYRARKGRYGAPRIHAELVARNVPCNQKTVAKLMRQAGIQAVAKQPFRPCTTDSRHEGAVAANLVGRKFSPPGPNQVWLADLTYIRTAQGFLYLAVVEDLFSRRIVGWSTSTRLHARLPVAALSKAVRERLAGREFSPSKTPTLAASVTKLAASGAKRAVWEAKLVVHTDRGVQYASVEYGQVLGRHGLRASMSRRGNCWDNAPVEAFFSTLKRELVFRVRYKTWGAARQSLSRFIEQFYNLVRRHSHLKYASPVEFEIASSIGAGT